MGDKSNGQKLLERVERFIRRFISFPDDVANGDQSLVLALWAIHTWVYEHFPVTPYVAITATTKEAGKTLCMEVVAALSRGPEPLATLRPLAMLRLASMAGGQITAFIDEAEKLSSSAIGDLRSIFTTGYSRGGQHAITMGPDKAIRFATFFPKMFALIGDVMDVVYSRAITIYLERNPRAVIEDFRGNAEAFKLEGKAITDDLRAYFKAEVFSLASGSPMFLQGRAREIWGPLFGLAEAMHLDKRTRERLIAVAMDLEGFKKGGGRRSSFDADAEAGAALMADAALAVEHLAQVLPEVGKVASGDVWTVTAIDRMRAIAAAPWRTYRGVGLDGVTLAELVGVFGLSSEVVREGRGRAAKALNGYKRAKVLEAAGKVKTAIPGVGADGR